MKKILVADESVDFGIISNIRNRGISVISVLEDHPGIPDSDVLEIANQHECILITEDKDFGELTHRLKLDHQGIVLIRLAEMKRSERIALASELITRHYSKFRQKFSVITKNGLRIKTIHTNE